MLMTEEGLQKRILAIKKQKEYRANYQREKANQRYSVRAPGTIQCLECGRYYKRVCNHVRMVHGMTAREYKMKYGLDVGRGILTKNARHIMREYTLHNPICMANLELGRATRFKKGVSNNYQRSLQTLARLKLGTRKGEHETEYFSEEETRG